MDGFALVVDAKHRDPVATDDARHRNAERDAPAGWARDGVDVALLVELVPPLSRALPAKAAVRAVVVHVDRVMDHEPDQLV